MKPETVGLCATCRHFPGRPEAADLAPFLRLSCRVALDVVREDDTCPEWTRRPEQGAARGAR